MLHRTHNYRWTYRVSAFFLFVSQSKVLLIKKCFSTFCSSWPLYIWGDEPYFIRCINKEQLKQFCQKQDVTLKLNTCWAKMGDFVSKLAVPESKRVQIWVIFSPFISILISCGCTDINYCLIFLVPKHLECLLFMLNRELCDIGDIGKLTREQFALALYLINQKLSRGIDPPQALAPEMIPPSDRLSRQVRPTTIVPQPNPLLCIYIFFCIILYS